MARALPEAAFGENFTTRELTENTVHIGDIFEVGEATVQVSQPRQPCFKLAARHEESKLALWVQETGRTGFYFRCLEPGWLRTRLSPSSSGARMASPSPRRTASCTRIRTMRRAPSGYSPSPNSPAVGEKCLKSGVHGLKPQHVSCFQVDHAALDERARHNAQAEPCPTMLAIVESSQMT